MSGGVGDEYCYDAVNECSEVLQAVTENGSLFPDQAARILTDQCSFATVEVVA